MEICAKPRNKPQFQGRTKVKFYFDAKAENVRANRIQVQQLLVNLLHNANDAMTVPARMALIPSLENRKLGGTIHQM